VKQLTSEGFPVVRTARQGVGDIWWTSVGGVNDAELGTIAGRELTPAKARILLMLALQSKRSREELQRIFDKLGTGEH
jgi:L-asparaginase